MVDEERRGSGLGDNAAQFTSAKRRADRKRRTRTARRAAQVCSNIRGGLQLLPQQHGQQKEDCTGPIAEISGSK
jgi:hypothetical protein